MIEGLKPFYNATLRPVGKLLAQMGIHPNVITMAGVALFCGAGWYAFKGQWRISLLFVIAGACMDGLDGLVAREYNKKSVFGAVFDSTCDRLTEIVWISGICAYYALRAPSPLGVLLCIAALSGSFMVSYVKARADGAGVPCTGGILQRPERIILLAACLLIGPRAMPWGLGVMAVVGYVTMVERLIAVAREASK
jgi:CDP-diacylglycerol--glycerol-3-phosphate 3-phosphatidyltransferase